MRLQQGWSLTRTANDQGLAGGRGQRRRDPGCGPRVGGRRTGPPSRDAVILAKGAKKLPGLPVEFVIQLVKKPGRLGDRSAVYG